MRRSPNKYKTTPVSPNKNLYVGEEELMVDSDNEESNMIEPKIRNSRYQGFF